MKDKINPNLRKLAELTYNPNLELPDLEEIAKEAPIQINQLERGADGRPTIKLIPLGKTAVSIPTQEEYNTLMQVYEYGGWVWCGGDLPTSLNYYSDARKTCISVEEIFGYSSKEFFIRQGEKILSTQEFYNKQNITNDMIKEINEYFENER